ncbi:MAG: hypothetical protein ACKVX7_00290 [Planctomycetota bacterium]
MTDAECHVSVDDVFGALVEASDSGAPLFAHPFFARLNELHDRYGCPIDLYLFFRGHVDGNLRNLAQVSSRLKRDFDAARWLRLGPHALDYHTAPYAQPADELRAVLVDIYREIDRFAGVGSRSKWLRLHYFSEAFEQASYLDSQGVTTLLLTDKDAVSYRLPMAQKLELERRGRVRYADLDLVRSTRRLEHFAAVGASDPEVLQILTEKLRQEGRLALFTHEHDLAKPRVEELLRLALELVVGNSHSHN